jgi:hypothetical protein
MCQPNKDHPAKGDGAAVVRSVGSFSQDSLAERTAEGTCTYRKGEEFHSSRSKTPNAKIKERRPPSSTENSRGP